MIQICQWKFQRLFRYLFYIKPEHFGSKIAIGCRQIAFWLVEQFISSHPVYRGICLRWIKLSTWPPWRVYMCVCVSVWERERERVVRSFISSTIVFVNTDASLSTLPHPHTARMCVCVYVCFSACLCVCAYVSVKRWSASVRADTPR